MNIQRLQVFRNGRMHPKQNYPATFETTRPLQGELPEIFVECQDQSAICFSAIEQGAVFYAGAVCTRPKNVVTLSPEYLDGRERKVLVRQKSHSGRNWEGFVLVRKITCIGQAREYILPRQTRVVGDDIAIGLTRSQ